MAPPDPKAPPVRKISDSTKPGTQDNYRKRSDSPPYRQLPHTLQEFREQEGKENRKRRLKALWKYICESGYNFNPQTAGRLNSADKSSAAGISLQKAEKLRAAYENELLNHVGGNIANPSHIAWKEFKEYAEAKELELWTIFHDELDIDNSGTLDVKELDHALRRTGINLHASTLSEFMEYLTSSPDSKSITFGEFRDFLLLLPRKVSAAEIYQFYQMKKFLGDDGRGVARVTMEGDVSLSAEDKPPHTALHKASNLDLPSYSAINTEDEEFSDEDEYEEEGEEHRFLEGHTAVKFLFAGGIAGAVSRTCTAPFDRLKIFLITRSLEVEVATAKPTIGGVKVIGNAIVRLYSEGGVTGFWTGNGLSVAKIFPESAIKFFMYESSKRAFAKYWDHVDDPREISGVSRFLSGGVGGISSQLSIYPIETLKTQMMSNTGQRRTLIEAVRRVWSLGGFRAYYRGLTIGLVGVFPYSAIDMSTFEALKLAYLKSTGKDEPGVLALLAFGSVSGSVGATSVYPLNLVRTRLQASGSSGHPQIYTGVWDVVGRTWEREGWKGFYRGLFPTLAKVVPSVSISYVVYEHTKRRLGI